MRFATLGERYARRFRNATGSRPKLAPEHLIAKAEWPAHSRSVGKMFGRKILFTMKTKNPTPEKMPAPTPSPAKKTYSRPEFRHEKVFEVTALACGKIGPTQRSCRFNRKVS